MGERTISASELERFCYCPLSWWLSKDKEMVSETLQEGERKHEDLSSELLEIIHNEKKAMMWERAVLWFSLTATILALIGLFIFNKNMSRDLIWLSSLPSIMWIGLILYLVYRSWQSEQTSQVKSERIMAMIGIVIVFIVLNAIIIFDVPVVLASIFMVLSLFWLIGTSIALYISLSAQRISIIKRQQVNLSKRISYVGNGDAPILRSDRYNITGKPDYIMEDGNELIPVELKSGRQPQGPLFSHIVQLATYCLILSEREGKFVNRGVLRYGSNEFDIDFDDDLRDLVLAKVDEMRYALRKGEAHRNHNRPGKCQSCSRRDVCPEKLV